MNRFKNPLDPENMGIKKAIRQWVTDRLSLNESVNIEITEHHCTEASCVHAETVISVSDSLDTEGGYLFYKITKPLVYIRKIDIVLMQETPTLPKLHKH